MTDDARRRLAARAAELDEQTRHWDDVLPAFEHTAALNRRIEALTIGQTGA